jgi:hypothetical protein
MRNRSSLPIHIRTPSNKRFQKPNIVTNTNYMINVRPLSTPHAPIQIHIFQHNTSSHKLQAPELDPNSNKRTPIRTLSISNNIRNCIHKSSFIHNVIARAPSCHRTQTLRQRCVSLRFRKFGCRSTFIVHSPNIRPNPNKHLTHSHVPVLSRNVQRRVAIGSLRVEIHARSNKHPAQPSSPTSCCPVQWCTSPSTHNTMHAVAKRNKHSNNSSTHKTSLQRVNNKGHVFVERSLHSHVLNIDRVLLHPPNNALLAPNADRRNNRSNSPVRCSRVDHNAWNNSLKLVRGQIRNKSTVRNIRSNAINNA